MPVTVNISSILFSLASEILSTLEDVVEALVALTGGFVVFDVDCARDKLEQKRSRVVTPVRIGQDRIILLRVGYEIYRTIGDLTGVRLVLEKLD